MPKLKNVDKDTLEAFIYEIYEVIRERSLEAKKEKDEKIKKRIKKNILTILVD